MNPFNERMSNHGTWPVILTMYNIPTYLCQKRKYIFLTVLVSGPKQPGIDIDVFLEPVFLDGSKKVIYIRNQCFLKIGHKYRGKLYLRYYGNILKNEPPL
jgi:hypothetical protein